MRDLTELQRDLLYIIAGLERPYGLKIKSELENYYGEHVDDSVVYDNLSTLTDDEVVETHYHDGRTKVYSLTEAGTELLEGRRLWEDTNYFEGR